MFNSTKKVLAGLAALCALALGGAAIADATSSGTTSSTTATTSTQGAGAPQRPPMFNGPAHGTAAHENAEKAVTGDAATKAQAAAVKSVGSGTAGSVTTDYSGKGYEVTVTKSDGTKVEVHLDSSFNLVAGPRGHGGPGGHGGPMPGGPPPKGPRPGSQGSQSGAPSGGQGGPPAGAPAQ